MTELRTTIVRGVAWNGIAQLGNQAINLAVVVLLTRLLPAADFGLVAMAGVFTGFFLAFPGLGLGAALVQKPDVEERHFASVYRVNLGISAVLAGLVAAIGPLAAWLFGEPELTAILGVLSVQFPLTALGAISRVHLRRDLRFDVISRIELSAGLLSGAVGVVFALGGAGVWSMVARSLAVAASSSALFVIARPYRPRVETDWGAVRECRGFGLSFLGRELLSYSFRNADNLLVGKYLGAAALGLYSRAYAFMLVPLLGVANVVAGVLFPAFARIQDDDDRLRSVFLRVSGAIALGAHPISIWFVVAAEPFVHVVLGPRWAEMIVLLQILCVTGIWDCANGVASAVFRGKGRADLHLRVTLVSYAFALVAFAIGLRWGVQGVAVGCVAASLVVTWPAVYFACALVGLSFRTFLRHVGGVLAIALSAGAVGYAALCLVEPHFGHAATLAATTASFGLAYAAGILLLRPAPFRDAMALVRATRSKAEVADSPT